MKLRRFLLRYYPPGIILEYEQVHPHPRPLQPDHDPNLDPGPSPNRDPEQGGELRNKPVDLLTLTPESDLEVQCTRLDTVAASLTYGCSLPYIRLQPPLHTVAASLARERPGGAVHALRWSCATHAS